jgi:hypothetical protein
LSTSESNTMSEKKNMENDTQVSPNRKRRNIILGLILAAASLLMYASIFLRLTEKPLQ